MVTVVLVALLLSLAVPTFGNILANSRMRVEINALLHAVHLARKESITRRRVVSVCPTQNGAACAPGSGWSMGWMIFVNNDRDWPAVRDSDEPVLRVHTVDPANRVTANRASFSLRSTELRATNGTLVFCDRAGRGTPRALIISFTGRPRVAYRNSRGKAYSCAS
jgi:type IV fimbrial biogenesis protein FimT